MQLPFVRDTDKKLALVLLIPQHSIRIRFCQNNYFVPYGVRFHLYNFDIPKKIFKIVRKKNF